MENTYASKHFFFNKKYLSYNQNLTAICSGYNLPAGYAKISMPYTYEPLPYQLAFFRQFVDGADDMLP